ncbi:tetratricopeptide repeat protein [Erythrobacter sp. Dej080120_24]|uniref:tetratricopeptide repeat protein n=1 Tax=Erythrobacter sp. Dej080120_24 TaxID=3024837 RepID=UPI0030C6FCFB
MNNFHREMHADPYSAELKNALILRNTDPRGAYAVLSSLAEEGSPLANMVLGEAYLFGHNGLQKDERLAEKLLRRAAKLESFEGSFLLARYLRMKGRSEEAVSIYEALSEANFPAAAFVLGLSYLDGKFTEIDQERAKFFLEIAAENGHLHAQDWLAHLVTESDASVVDHTKAIAKRYRLKKQIEKLSRTDPKSDYIRTI